jgi:hypothetical protein
MARDRQMAELRGLHAQRMNALFRKFLRDNPDIDPGLDIDTWTLEQTAMWREVTAAENKRFAEERGQRAKQLRHERVAEH